ncbi:MAG TPA: SDR family oxidoreductase, partial [Anaerolineales bacterium]|nr:SDR family oxidoreductase [Anaerolineales bacterium]
CDVRQPEQVQVLWDGAQKHFGQVDIWINNAGLSSQQGKAWLVSPEVARQVVETNLLGVIHGSRVAVAGMLAQGYGSLYNMEGMGSDGRMHDGLTLYGTTKYALRYFTDSLVKETAGTGLVIGALRPGMVVTDLITRQYEGRPEDWERARRIFNLIAERVEVVAPWLAEQILANRKHGRRLRYMSTWKMLTRLLALPFRKRDVFAQEL